MCISTRHLKFLYYLVYLGSFWIITNKQTEKVWNVLAVLQFVWCISAYADENETSKEYILGISLDLFLQCNYIMYAH